MEEIFLIEKIWIDSMENEVHGAYGYEPYRWTSDPEEASKIINAGKVYTSADCWAIVGSMPEYKCRKLKSLDKQNKV
jgi:hypothetical protein